MERCPWEANSNPATQEIPNILCNPKVHYRVYSSPSLVLILSQMNPVYTTTTYFSNIRFSLSAHLFLDLSSGIFPSGIPTKLLYALIFFSYLLHDLPIWSLFPSSSNYILGRVQVTKLLVMQFAPTSYYFIPFLLKYSPRHLVLKYLHSVRLP
jgi:hypothetical protein